MNACSFGPAPWWVPALHDAVTALALLGGAGILIAAAIAMSPGLRDLAWNFMYRDTPQSPMCPPVRWDGTQLASGRPPGRRPGVVPAAAIRARPPRLGVPHRI